MQYQLLLLGKFGIEPVQKLSLERKTRAILAYLAATAETHPRRFLWELFCPTTKDPAGTLRWHLSRIRREVDENILHITTQEVALNTAVAQTDLALFQQTCHDPNQSNTESLAEAVDLYRGPFLDGLELNNMPEFDLWLLGMRTRCQQLYEKGASALIERYIQQQAHQAAIQQAQKLLQTNSLLENNHRQLIWLYAEMGQRESALKQYDHCRTLLQEELAVEPATETIELVTAVHRNQPLPPILPEEADAAPYIPTVTAETEFVGRQAECQQLQAQWQAGQQTGKTTVLITAVAGGGKTCLVEKFLQTLPPNTAILSGKCYESTRSTPYQPWLTVLESWAARLTRDELHHLAKPWKAQLARLLPHLFPATPDAPEKQEHIFQAVAHLLFMTQKTTAVIFIDDLHWADEASLQLLLFLIKYARQTVSSWMLIGTVRSEEIEDNYALQTFMNDIHRDKTVTILPLPPLTTNDVDTLIRQLWPNVPLTEKLSEIKAGLLAETEGNPLFLTELLRELGQTAVLPSPLPVPPSLQELTNHRLQQMPLSSRQVLETLAVLDQPIHFELVQQISGRTEDETLTAFELGLRWRFLQPHASAQYDFSHELIRSAVKHQLSDVRRQRLHLRAAQTLTRRDEEATTLAYHWGMAGDQNQEARYALLAGNNALSRAAFANAIRLYQIAAAAFPAALPQEQFQATLGIVKALDATSNTENLPKYLAQLAKLAEKLGTPEEQAEAATYQARFALYQGDSNAATSFAKKGLEWATVGPNKSQEAALRKVLGDIYQAQGDFATAQSYTQQALELYQSGNDKRGQASVLGTLGGLYLHQGKHQQAVSILRLALDLCHYLADPFTESRILARLANALWHLGEYDEVKLIAERGLVVCQQIGDKESEAIQLNNLAGLAMAKQDYQTAIEFYRKALAVVEAENQPSGISVYNNNIGGAYIGLGEPKAALPYLQKAITEAQAAGLPRMEAQAHHTTGCAYRELNDPTTARSSFERALSLRQELGLQVQILLTLIQLTQTCIDLDDFAAAETHFHSAKNAFRELQNQIPQYAHQMFHYTAYLFYTALNNPQEASKSLRLANQALQNRLAELDEAEKEHLRQQSNSQEIFTAMAKLSA